MKRRFALAIAFLCLRGRALAPRLAALAAALLWPALLWPALAAAAESEKLVLYGDRNLPPYEFLDGGRPRGAMVDLVHALATRMGRKPEVLLDRWDDSQQAVLGGAGNGLTLMTRTQEREANYDFSAPTFEITFSLFVRADRKAMVSPRNLAGLRIGVTNGGFPQGFLRQYHPEATLVVVEDSADGIRRVLRHEIDAVAGNTWALEYFLSELNISGVAVVTPPLVVRQAAIALRKGQSPQLLADVNAALREVKADGSFDRIMDNWSAKKVYVVTQDEVSRAAASAGRVALAVLLIGVAVWLFRRQRRALAAEVEQRRRSEVALRESENLFKSVFDTDACGIVILEPDGRMREANARYCEMTGYGHDELSAHGAGDFTHPDDVAREKPALQAYLRDETPQFQIEKRYVRKDGKVIWVALSSAPVRDADGRTLFRVAIASDISARKEAEDAAQRSAKALAFAHERLTATLQASPAMVFTQDRELHYTFVANAALAFGDADPIGSTDAALLARADDAERLTELKRRVLESGESAREEVGVFVGEALAWFDLSVHPQFEDGGIVGIVGTAVDTTERHDSELRLREAMAAAARADNAKSRFLAAASHDLRQPLAALSVYASSLRRHVGGPGEAMLSNMQDCIASLGELLTDLLDLSKLEAGVVSATVSHFPLAEVMTQLESIHAPEAAVKGLRLRFVPTRVTARTDPVLLQRILGNLVANAIRYTHEGGVLVGCREHQGRTWVEVWDTGIGIPADKIDEIFEEFRQLDDDARTRGSGLGLAIVARTAELLGLRVRVRSRPGRGSMFAVELPRGHLAHVARPPRRGPGSDVAALRIALVEDNRDFREALVMSLQTVGHAVCAASSSAELVRRLGDFDADMLIADYRLPRGENGFDAIHAARAVAGADLPAILLTGDTDPRLVRSMADRGVTVLHKPIDFETLHAVLADVVADPAGGSCCGAWRRPEPAAPPR